MENTHLIKPHPQFQNILFAYKGTISKVFKEVIGLHDIAHLALARICQNNEIVSLSSTPAMEFNLFKSPLWRYDASFNPNWFRLGKQSPWQNLYSPARYDELYYLKQSQHQLTLGVSLANKLGNDYFIYSLATRTTVSNDQQMFLSRQAEFSQIGHYCTQQLMPILDECNEFNVRSFKMTA